MLGIRRLGMTALRLRLLRIFPRDPGYKMEAGLSKAHKVKLPCSKNRQDKYAQLYIVKKVLHDHLRRHILRTTTERIS